MLGLQQTSRTEPIERDARLRERSLNAPLGPTTISAGGVIGVAIGGSFLLLVFALSTLIFHARRQDRRERQRITEEVLAAEEQMDFKAAVDLICPPEITFARTLSQGPYQPRGGRIVYTDWDNLDPIADPPPMAKTRKTMDPRSRFRMSGVRGSWPLANIPLSLLPAQSTLTLNQVAPPGYVVAPDSKWPRRNSSRNSRTRIAVPSPDSLSQTQTPDPVTPTPRSRKPHQRSHSTSEAHLSTILRSTSQRLKRSSLTRTLTTFSRMPGSPPKERLPTPTRQANQSSEGLIENRFFESPDSSMFDAYMQTPSPQKCDDEDPNQTSSKQPENSPTSSATSEDSLCDVRNSEILPPGHLTSLSKQNNSAQMHQLHISTNTSNRPTLIGKDSRASTMALGEHHLTHTPQNIHSDMPSISLAGDPFYSRVRSAKPVHPKPNLSGPRPPYGRKATFGLVGQDATIKRPLSYTSPLQDVSGNAQSPQRLSDSHLSSISNEEDRNPFQWSPQEAMQNRQRQLSPKRSGSKGKGHKRSNVIRMSNLTRPTSAISVDPVMEESEDDLAELRFNVPPTPPLRTLRLVAPSKSPSPSPFTASRRLSDKPPSISTFNPAFAVPDLESPSNNLGLDQPSPSSYSPTLSASNYYLEHSSNSEEDFFKSKRTSNPTKTSQLRDGNSISSTRQQELPIRTLSHLRDQSSHASLPSTEPEKFISFPSPIISPKMAPTRPPSTIIVSPDRLVQASPTLLAPPILTIPIPGHLTGPRCEPLKSSPSPRASVHSVVCTLRRMNSEVSQYSAGSDTDGLTPSRSPDFPSLKRMTSNLSNSTSLKKRTTRGSRHYLSLGMSAAESRTSRSSLFSTGSVHRNSRPLGVGTKGDPHNSSNIYKERRRRRLAEEFSEADLQTVREIASPPTSIMKSPDSIEGFKFPEVPSSLPRGTEASSDTPIRSPQLPPRNPKRWSDAMSKSPVNAVRRESQIESPTPKSSPVVWEWETPDDFGLELPRKRATTLTGDGTKFCDDVFRRSKKMSNSHLRNDGTVRPQSLGLYDEDGFLRMCSLILADTPLTLFTTSDCSTLYTSEAARYTKYSGYLYPEVRDRALSNEDLASEVTAAVSKLYNPESQPVAKRIPGSTLERRAYSQEWILTAQLPNSSLDTGFSVKFSFGTELV
ncbi:hypothetical protein BJ875DRAFT_495240 [Amylocarpus encephaloides]|uniref:Uncharacterized protein n=1 Tax=Amylocarpus encephaloides TaxID=45428 RepID=A0A9P8C6E1_9HELO|nr:hypothetical protein BJ875DRAFT_495240 [Amylocarpus encephaloides]